LGKNGIIEECPASGKDSQVNHNYIRQYEELEGKTPAPNTETKKTMLEVAIFRIARETAKRANELFSQSQYKQAKKTSSLTFRFLLVFLI
jgi:hypothetical protein